MQRLLLLVDKLTDFSSYRVFFLNLGQPAGSSLLSGFKREKKFAQQSPHRSWFLNLGQPADSFIVWRIVKHIPHHGFKFRSTR